MNKLIWHKALQELPVSNVIRRHTPVYVARNQFTRHASSAPTIAQPSFWKSLIPKPLRRRSEQPEDWRSAKKPKSKDWNPATFFIVIFLFIGSMSIQMIALKKDFNTFTRRAEVRIGLLREVVEKLQRGEEVDVEKMLGTGDDAKEKEWEEMLREIERDDILKTPPRKAEKTRQSPSNSTVPEAKVESKTESTESARAKKVSYSNFF